MISNEEMYEFASQIAGITDNDLQQYKCGGKTKKSVKKMEEGKKIGELGVKNLKNLKNKSFDTYRQQKELEKEKQEHTERFNKDGSRKYNTEEPTNEDWNPNEIKKRKK